MITVTPSYVAVIIINSVCNEIRIAVNHKISRVQLRSQYCIARVHTYRIYGVFFYLSRV